MREHRERLWSPAIHIRAHVGWLTWEWGLPPHWKWKHGSTELEAQRSLPPPPLSSPSPRDPMTQIWPWPRLRFIGHTGRRRRVAEPVPVGGQLDARWKPRSGKLRQRSWKPSLLGYRTTFTTLFKAHRCLLPTGNQSSSVLNMEEIEPPENVTWEQLLPGLPPNGQAAHVRLIDVLEGPLREQLMSPASVFVAVKTLASSTAQSQSVGPDREGISGDLPTVCRNGLVHLSQVP